MIVAETPRLRLRRLLSSDAPFIVELLNDPDFIRNVGDRGVRTLADAQRYIESGPAASYARHGFGLYVVELRDAAAAAGLCGLLHRDTHPDVEIGFALLPRYRRHGYTLEAARAALRLGMETLRLRRIVAITAPDNLPSVRILETLGLKFAGLVRFAEDGRESRLYVLESVDHDTSAAH
ncbi:MAG TPA: GNAT family N-acetyltransferase [Steroidobacteraceae bacterium]|nr:GNAT family N-acetyltransferase [Steroidobacteraceae bacterium]